MQAFRITLHSCVATPCSGDLAYILRLCVSSGGANVPALNDLLAPYGIAFGDAVLEGQAMIDGEQVYYASGANIVRFPAGGHLHALALGDKATTGARPLSITLGFSPHVAASDSPRARSSKHANAAPMDACCT